MIKASLATYSDEIESLFFEVSEEEARAEIEESCWRFRRLSLLQDVSKDFTAFLKAVRKTAKKMSKALLPLAHAIQEAERGPAIGRKRRKRRARG